MVDLGSFFKGSMASLENNGTSFPANMSRRSYPDNLLESLAPLLGGSLVRTLMPLHSTLGSGFGFDPTLLLTLFGTLWAFNRLWKQVSAVLYKFVQEHLMARIHISSGDDIYLHMMKWLAAQPKMTNSRSLMAETVGKTAWEDEDESAVLTTSISADGSGVYLNFSNQEAKSPPRFTPAMGLHSFWWNGTYFLLQRKHETFYDDSTGNGVSALKDKEDLVISCFGRSPEPIKKLLQHAKEGYFNDHYARTIVKRPSPQTVRRFGNRHAWLQVANRPVRPMRTVVLDAKEKMQILSDINEYLHPATPRWYANRGIPLRRGYLFHGPPGTGKTSLSFALAGIFGLDIYVISLLEPTLTEEDLLSLFNSLPRRCVVLLEDIDTAGLGRAPDKVEGEGGGSSSSAAAGGVDANTLPANEWKVTDLARALKKDGGADEKKGISLSGLLNAIDGVASHEGRVLIMTTNKPETLDEALIRPGRVDLQVAFTNATREQARELFERMYEDDQARAAPAPEVTSSSSFSSPSGGRQHGAGAVLEVRMKGSPSHSGLRHRQTRPNGTDKEESGSRHEQDPAEKSSVSSSSSDLPSTGPSSSSTGKGRRDEEESLDISPGELARVAGEFAAKIPDGQFSPAEIQGFLLKRKKNPLRAVEEADVWVEAMMNLKASRTKIMRVQ